MILMTDMLYINLMKLIGMNYNFNNYKGRVLYSAFILLLLSSCLSISKIIIGFKTPKVYNVTDIRNLKDEIFNDNLNNDYYFQGIKDTVFLNKILSLSFQGSLNIYNNNGKKIFFKKTTCVNDEIKIINSKVDSLQFNSKKETLETDLKNLININSNNQFKFIDLKENEYYVIYYWSSFMAKKKSIKNEFDFLKNSFNNNYKIIRVNCDFLDIWGLKKDKKVKLQITKENNSYYNVKFKKIPWKQ